MKGDLCAAEHGFQWNKYLVILFFLFHFMQNFFSFFFFQKFTKCCLNNGNV